MIFVGDERFFIVSDESPDYFMEWGWVFFHSPAHHMESNRLIGLACEFVNEPHELAPKDLLTEITKKDYDLLSHIIGSGYDGSSMIEQIIKYRKNNGLVD